MYSFGTWLQWSSGTVTHVISTQVVSKAIEGSMTIQSQWLYRVNDRGGVKGYLGVNDFWFKFLKKRLLFSDKLIMKFMLWGIFMEFRHLDTIFGILHVEKKCNPGISLTTCTWFIQPLFCKLILTAQNDEYTLSQENYWKLKPPLFHPIFFNNFFSKTTWKTNLFLELDLLLEWRRE